MNFYPEQIVGDPNNSKIYLLNLNPSFGPSNFVSLAPMQQTIENCIKGQYDKDYPFYCLNGNFDNTDGYKWWNNGHHFTSWKNKFSNTQLAKAFCCLELFPYHCKNLPISRKKMLTCPSTKKIIDFVKTEIVPKAKNNEAAIIVLRCNKEWGLIEDINNNIYVGTKPRNSYFGRNMYGVGSQKNVNYGVV